MEFITPTKTSKFFTAGKYYPILDGSAESGIYTADDDNMEHYLSPEYLLYNFKCYVTIPDKIKV